MLSRSSRPSRISDSSSTTRMEPLDMNRFPRGGELQPEGSALPRRRAHVQLAGMLLDDPVADQKPQAGAAARRLRGEEGIEDAIQIFARNARAGVLDFHFDRSIVRGRADLDRAARGHGVAR